MGLLDREMIRSQDCIRAFERMFWAFLFFVDFRIGINNVHVDILPDFIGWILMATALGWILQLHSDIKGIRTLTFCLIFLSIFDLIELRKQPTGFSVNISITPLVVIGMIAGILAIIVIWKLCGVIIDMATAVDNLLIKQRADFRRKFYIGFIIAIFVAIGISVIVPAFIFITVIVGLPLAIVVFCLLMGLMKGTAKMCRQSKSEVIVEPGTEAK